jgi:hypothetical protein
MGFMVKAVIIFLVIMVGLALMGRLRLPGQRRATATCRSCGRPKIGTGPCACGKE